MIIFCVHLSSCWLVCFFSFHRLQLLPCCMTQPVHPKGDQSWVFIGRTDAEAKTPILWPPEAKSWLIWKDPDVGKDWRQEEKGMTEDEMFGWHHRLDGHRFGWTPGVGDGQGGLACCGSWGCKESDTTDRLNWTDWILGGLSHILARTTGAIQLAPSVSSSERVETCKAS